MDNKKICVKPNALSFKASLMKLVVGWILALLLLPAPLARGGASASQQNNPAQLLVPGQPPLTQGMVDGLQFFFEWVLEGRLTAEQRDEFRQQVIDEWRRRDQGTITTSLQALQLLTQLANATDAQRKAVQSQLQAGLVPRLRQNQNQQIARLLLSVYEAAHNQSSAGSPSGHAPTVEAGGEAGRLKQQIDELFKQRKYDEAIPLEEQLAAMQARAHGPDHPEVATALNDLAALYLAKSDFKHAEPFLQRSLAIREKAFGPDHPLVAFSLSNLAALYKGTNDLARAEQLYQRALSIREKEPGTNGQDLAEALDDLAAVYKAKRDYTRAEPLYQRALAIREKAFGPVHPAVFASLNNLAALYQLKGDFTQAESVYQRSLATAEKGLGPNHSVVSGSMLKLAELYEEKGDYARAEPLYQRALAIDEKVNGPTHPYTAITLNNLGRFYEGKGDFAQAEQMLQRALEIRLKNFGPDHPDVATSLNSLAGLYVAKGDFTKAEQMYQRALEIREKKFGTESAEVAPLLHNLAELYVEKSDYVRAEPLLQRALAVAEKAYGPDAPELATALGSLGRLYADKGDYARAEPLMQRALAVREKRFGPDHPDVAGALNDLAALYQSKNDLARAEPLYRRALAIREKALGADHPDVAASLNNLGALYVDRGDYARAEPLYQRALAIFEKVHGPNHPMVGKSAQNLAQLYNLKGDYARAEPMFQRALTILQKTLGPNHPSVAVNLNNLGTLYQASGQTAQAIRVRTNAADITERNLSLILTTGSENQKRLYMETLTGQTYATISLHVRDAPKDAAAARLALTTVLRRKGRALDATTDQIGALRRHLDPQDRALLDQLSTARSQLSALTLKGAGQADPAQHLAEVARLEAEVERLEAQVSSRSAEFRAKSQPVTLERVQQAIPARAALVELVSYLPFNAKARSPRDRYGAARYVAYVVQSGGEPSYVDLGEAAPIDQGVVTLRTALSDPQSADVKQAARALDELVMRPVRNLLGPTRTLFLSPDGALNLVPFSALVDERNRYLIENYSITYLTSGRDLLRLQVRAQSKQEPVVIANPSFDLADAAGAPEDRRADGATGRRSADFTQFQFSPLEGTAGEARALKNILPSAQVLTGAQATEAALKKVAGPSILHVATHGFFLPDQPVDPEVADTRSLALSGEEQAARGENLLLRSGLALAGANKRQSGAGEDGVLTALEASGLDLWGTKLVVLSACETGVGNVKNGDGVYGLRRALVLAGAESELMSLWQVSDAATRDLMVEYYKRLEAGEGRSEGLRQVQLGMLHSAGQGPAGENRGLAMGATQKASDRSHPFYWASFIPIGDWRSLEGRETGSK